MTIMQEAPPVGRADAEQPPVPPVGPPGPNGPGGNGRRPDPETSDWRPVTPDRPGFWAARSGSWQQAVLVRAAALRARARCPGHLVIDPAGEGSDPALDLIDVAADAARRPDTPRRWWYGTLLERSWMCLHEAEAMLAERESIAVLRARLPGLIGAAETALACTDPRLAAARQVDTLLAGAGAGVGNADTGSSPAARAGGPGGAATPGCGSELDARARHQVGELIRAVYGVWDERYARSRNFRNRLIRTFVILVALLAGLVLLAALAGHTPPVCGQRAAAVAGSAVDSCPSHHPQPDTVDLVLVLAFGGIGGLLGALPSLARMGGSWNRFGLPAWQAALKAPTGAFTGLFGGLLLNAGIAQLSQTGSPAGLLVTALGFGAAQQAVTRYIDRSTESLLAAAPSKEEREHLTSAAGKDQPADAVLLGRLTVDGSSGLPS